MLNNLLREKDKEELIQIIRDLEEKLEGEIIAEFDVGSMAWKTMHNKPKYERGMKVLIIKKAKKC